MFVSILATVGITALIVDIVLVASVLYLLSSLFFFIGTHSPLAQNDLEGSGSWCLGKVSRLETGGFRLGICGFGLAYLSWSVER